MSNTDRTALVVGSTGTQGGPVARALLDAGYEVRAATRNPDSPTARALAERGAKPVQVGPARCADGARAPDADMTPAREILGVTFTPVEDWARRQDWQPTS